jgi:hypothetical protein
MLMRNEMRMQQRTKRSRWTGLAIAGALVLTVGAACTPKPRITLPANATQLDAAGTAVAIDLGSEPGPNAIVRVVLFRAVDATPTTSIDVTPLLARAGKSITGNLGPAELHEGRNRLLVSVDSNGDGAIDNQAWSTFSWEPNLDLANADRCDPLDASHCLYPFPNDHFTIPDATTPTGKRVHLSADSMPRNGANKIAQPDKWNVLDGFSVGPMILFQNVDLDLEQTGAPPITDMGRSLEPDSPIVLVDSVTHEQQLFWSERDYYYDVPDEERPVILRVGKNLPNARRFAVGVRNARGSDGSLLPPARLFQIYRDAIPTYDPVVEARRAHMEEVFAILADAGIPRDELVLAWDFTTQSVNSVAGKMLHMRDESFAALGGAAPTFAVTSVTEPSDTRIFRDVRGTFQVPLYMTTALPGALLRIGADGLPEPSGSFTANFRCMVPYAATTGGALPVHPARPSLYGHGLLGSENEVSAGNVRDMANEFDFVMCATKWTGMGEDDYPTALQILADFSNFPKFPERLHQGYLNFLFLGRLMIHPNGLSSHAAFQLGGQSLIDTTELFYDGNSQGGIQGGGLAAFAQDWTRAVLGVPGMNFSTLLNRSRDFDDFNLFFEAAYTDNLDRQLLLSVIEMLWEQTETSGHATHLTSDPYPNTPPKKILLHVALGDQQVAQVTAENEARTIGAHIHVPAVSASKDVPDVEPFFGIPPIPSYPFDGSAYVLWDSGNPWPTALDVPPVFEVDSPEWLALMPCPQRFDGDPHECPRRQPNARLQKSEFLKTNGAVVDVCNGQPCTAP